MLYKIFIRLSYTSCNTNHTRQASLMLGEQLFEIQEKKLCLFLRGLSFSKLQNRKRNRSHPSIPTVFQLRVHKNTASQITRGKADRESVSRRLCKHEDTRTQGKRKGGAGGCQCTRSTAEEEAGQPGMANVQVKSHIAFGQFQVRFSWAMS